MPDWMFGQEDKLESLRTKELGDGSEQTGESESEEIESGVASIRDPDAEGEGDGGMIDMPFDLFGDD